MDYHRLGLGNASSLVVALRLVAWGKNIIVDCIYDPLGERRDYQLAFDECSQLRIDSLASGPVGEPQADLIGITLGDDNHRTPAVLTTDLFELHVRYGQFRCIQFGHGSRAPGLVTTASS